jgi:hypothetical protein
MAAWLWHRLRRAFALAATSPVTTLLCFAILTFACVRPAFAAERIKIDAASGTGGTTPLLSGTIVRSANATTTWFLYQGACADRAAGTWAPRATPQADSLNSYAINTQGPYTIVDQTAQEILWHVSDVDSCTPGTTCPPAIGGSRMLWCGKSDSGWIQRYGYPNFTYQILYLDTGNHVGNYNLTLSYNISTEPTYDNVYLIGGGGGAVDPIGNSRAMLDNIIASGAYLVNWRGSITPSTPNATGGSTLSGGFVVSGGSGDPSTVTGASFTIDGSHRALYILLTADCLYSNEDGLWPFGHGVMWDNISTSDNGAIYTDEAPAGGTDAFGGAVIKGTPGAPVISARVPPPVGTYWQLETGNNLPTPDFCTPKTSVADRIFTAGNSAAGYHTVPGFAASIVSCTFPIPAGTASILALWSQYLDLPSYSGYVQFAEYRYYREGAWSAWRNTNGNGTRIVGSSRAWATAGDELADAVQADSVQLRYSFRCVRELAGDLQNCGDVQYGILYDDLRLEVTTGVSHPSFGIYPAFLAQSTFVDGTINGVGCNPGTVAAGQCWPGVRGSDIGSGLGIHDNFNSPLGDSIAVTIRSGLRGSGKGVNWHRGFDRSAGDGLVIAHTNPNFVASWDAPRVIYRLFDPASKTWSPFDSSELDANSVSVAGLDTVLLDSRFRMNWPPRDKIGFSLPGGFSVGGKTFYSQLTFLPRGTRIQYYFKAVDLNGGTIYQFSSDALAHEAEDLPTLPGSAILAPDIAEYDVLPGAYAPGPAGTQLFGRTTTPILNVDAGYTAWNYGVDPVSQALRALGVRADRYRLLQGTEQGGNIGGHEFAGTRPGRLANYFPNMDEYAIRDSLALWYRIVIGSTHRRGSFSALEETDSKLLHQWWDASTGADGGDRCILLTGNDAFNALNAAPPGVPHPNENALANATFGVASVADQWNGTGTVLNPIIKDQFADPAAGPGLGVSGAYSYPIDGDCPGPDRFDALTKIGSAETQNAATYPTFSSVTNVAAVSNMTEHDVLTDHDRNKALGYGFSIQAIRFGRMNLVDTRAQVLYKFLTSCRGPRGVSDTTSCWPCPTDANKYSNWATSLGFQTGTYGPLYSMQDATRVATAIDPTPPPAFIDALQQNRPNPFNPETVIPYSISSPGRVSVRVFDVRGRLVRTLVDAWMPPGVHVARWNGQIDSGGKSASGVYFYVITYPDGHILSRKMTILR